MNGENVTRPVVGDLKNAYGMLQDMLGMEELNALKKILMKKEHATKLPAQVT